jgi:hypothetical protein
MHNCPIILSIFWPKFVYYLVSIVSKRPRVISFGYQSTPEKLITNVKISCPPFDIHKSKLAIAELHSIEASKAYNYLVFPINLGSNS